MKRKINNLSHTLFLIICSCCVLYSNELGDTSVHQLDTIEVIAKIIEKDVIQIADKEERIGIHDDVNKIIFLNPGINRVPEVGSQLLVNGGSIYDNLYLINEVPMFVPAHFSGHTFLDVSNILVPALQKFNLITQDIPGNFTGASNCVISVEPGIYRVSKQQWRKRPQVLLSLGTYDAGICLSVPFRNAKDLYQITANVPNAYLISYKNGEDHSYIWWDLSYYNENSNPIWYEDFTFTGENQLGKATLKEHLWLALDVYSSTNASGKKIIPWGVGSISLKDSNRMSRWKFTVGGSRQYFKKRRILGTVVTEKEAVRTNGSIYGEMNTIDIGSFLFDLNVRGEYLEWTGDSKTYRKQGATTEKSFGGDEVTVTAHIGLKNSYRRFFYGTDILCGGTVVDYSFFVDPGVWAQWLLDKGYVAFQCGIQTSWPDIRGLPQRYYRNQQIKTYMGSFAFQKDLFSRLHVLLQSYLKWKDHCTALSSNPEEFWWDPGRATPLFSRGISGEWSVDIHRILSFHFIHDICRSQRVNKGSFTTYEWDIPWSFRPILQFRLLNEKLNLYLLGVFAKGLPYQELVLQDDELFFSKEMSRMPWYRRVDLKLQFHQPIREHRFFTGFSAYLDIINIFDVFDRFRQMSDHYWENVREYYWNEYMVKKPVYLERSTVSLGVRASFRM